MSLRPRRWAKVPCYHTLTVKRLVVVSVGLAALMAGVMLAWYAVRQEREFRRLIAAGDAALAAEQTYGAIEAFSGALVLKSDSMLAHLKRGDTYRRRGELTAALRDLREATNLDPSAPRPVELLGDVNTAMGRYPRAAEHYRTFIALDDRSPRVLYKLALAYYRNGQAQDAIGPLRSAVAMNDRFTEVHYLLGMCLRDRGQNDEAQRALTRAVEINPAFVAAREELVDLFERAGRRQDALDQLEALAALEPANAERLVSVGLAYARWGRTDAAILTLGRAAERNPDQPAVYTAIGRVWLDAAEPRNDRVALGKAIEALAPIAATATASSEALALYGRAMLLSGDVATAERILLQAAGRPPVEPDTFRRLADASQRLGHLAVARDALLRYVALADEREVDPATTARLTNLQQRLAKSG
jgi:tetratricopeptide (TPR) repeat protein